MELFRLDGKIVIDNTEAKKSIDETTKKAKEGSKEQAEALGKIGSVASTLGKGILGAGAAMGGAFVAAVEGTREYRTQMGLLESSFVTAGHTTETAKNTYSELNAVLGDSGQAVEASQHLAKITDDEKELQTWTDICTGVYSEFGEAIPLESLTESALEVQKNGQLTGGLVDALVWAGISEDEFQKKLDACTSEQERQDLIMNTLNDTYKDASNQYKETNKDVMEAQKANERLTDAFAEVGAVGEPIMTAIKNAVASMAEKAAPLIQSMIDKIKDMKQWMQDNQQTVQTWVGIILGATVAISGFVLVMKFGAIMTAASNAIKTVRLAMTALNAAFLANPIGIVIAAITGLVVAFVYLWNNVDGFKKFWIDTWEIIKKAASVASEWFMDTWDTAVEWFTDTWDDVVGWFSGQFDKIAQFAEDCTDAVSGFFSDAWKTIKSAWSSTVSFFVSIWNRIKSVFNTVVSFYGGVFKKAWDAIVKVWNHAVSFYVGIWKGIQNVFKNVASWFGNIFKNAWNAIKNVWDKAKSYFNGIWTGIQNVFKSVGSWFGNVFSGAWSKIKNVFSGWGTFFGGLWDKIKSKFTTIGSTLGSTMSNTVKTGMNAVLGKIETTINKGIGLINSAIKLANKLGFNVGTVGTLKLPRLAKGGIVTGATPAIVGEDGAEAIIPLENNTQWIDRVAERLNQSSYDPDTVPLLRKIITLLENIERKNSDIYLDSGTLVGELTPAIDRRLGYIATKKNRGNI